MMQHTLSTQQTAQKFGFGCSRAVYLGSDGLVMVGRTLDWMNPIPTDIYVYPAGMPKQSMSEGPMYRWTSKYGSVLAVSYDGGATEGMNDHGLVMNGLFCRQSQYPAAKPGSDTPVMSLAVIASYIIDNFSTVEESYEWFQQNQFGIAGATFDSGTVAQLHYAITDRTGDTMVVEFYGGQCVLYRGRNLQVLTNEPALSVHQAIQQYWDAIDGQTMLPGSHSSNDRFVRATYFINHVPKNLDYWGAYGALSSVMGVVTVPFMYEDNGKTISNTQWRSIADLTNSRYFFRFADSYADFWIDLDKLNLQPGAPVLKLDCRNHQAYAGCANAQLQESAPFKPMW